MPFVAGSQHYFVIALLIYVRLPLIARKTKTKILTRHFGKLPLPAEGTRSTPPSASPQTPALPSQCSQTCRFLGVPRNAPVRLRRSSAALIAFFFYGTPTHVTCRRSSCFLKNYRQLSAAESCGFTTGSVPNAFRTLQKYHTTAGKLQLNLEGRLLTRFSRR